MLLIEKLKEIIEEEKMELRESIVLTNDDERDVIVILDDAAETTDEWKILETHKVFEAYDFLKNEGLIFRKLGLKSLEKAIKEFNEWEGSAAIFLDTDDGEFETSVYFNDLSSSQSIPGNNFVSVYEKDEISGSKRIAARRREFIIKFSRLILEGYDPMQAQYKLADEFPLFN